MSSGGGGDYGLVSVGRETRSRVMAGSHRHRIGEDGGNKRQERSKFLIDFVFDRSIKNRSDTESSLHFLPRGKQKKRPFRPEFRTLLTFAGPSYPIL